MERQAFKPNVKGKFYEENSIEVTGLYNRQTIPPHTPLQKKLTVIETFNFFLPTSTKYIRNFYPLASTEREKKEWLHKSCVPGREMSNGFHPTKNWKQKFSLASFFLVCGFT